MSEKILVSLEVNGEAVEQEAEPRTLLSTFIRDGLGLTGTHVGCEHGICGACTVDLNGVTVRSCLTFAVQANGGKLKTVEGLLRRDGSLHPLQKKFAEHHALQCGFCTPGMLMACEEICRNKPAATREDVREGISGNLCRCTGYQTIVNAVADYLENPHD